MCNEERQADELLALENIYTQEEFKPCKGNAQLGGHFLAFIVFENDLKLLFKDLRVPDSCFQEQWVTYLPPLGLIFSFPTDYPASSPPDFTLSCQWLRVNDIAKLCRKLDSIWDENKGMEIIYVWTQFLKEEALKYLGIGQELDISKMYTYYLKVTEQWNMRRQGLSSGGTASVEQRGEALTSQRGQDDPSRVPSAGEDCVVEKTHADQKCAVPSPEDKQTGRDSRCAISDKRQNFSRSKKAVGQNCADAVRSHKDTGRNRSHCSSADVGGEGRNQQVVGERQKALQEPHAVSSVTKTEGNKCSDVSRKSVEGHVVRERRLNSRNNSSSVDVSTNTCPARKKYPARRKKQGRDKCKTRLTYDRRAIVDLNPRTPVIQHLVDYSNRQRELHFERSMHTCKICFEDKLGVYCTKFEPCRHVFCSDCMTNYFEVRIKEGTVLSITCPEDKCLSEAQPSHVRVLVSPEMYTKYDSILLSALLDTQPDMVYCPRKQCQYPVFHEDKSDKLATCPECNYAFCVLCEKVYHGVAPCAIVPEEKRKLMEEYLSASEEQKGKMDTRYGKQQLKNLVDTFHLEWCESWIKDNSKKCPHCNTAIEKSFGCNKMVCWKCDTVFCWLCNMRLDKLKPYHHFNDANSPCYNSLFQGVVMEEEFDEELDFDEEFVGEDEEEFILHFD